MGRLEKSSSIITTTLKWKTEGKIRKKHCSTIRSILVVFVHISIMTRLGLCWVCGFLLRSCENLAAAVRYLKHFSNTHCWINPTCKCSYCWIKEQIVFELDGLTLYLTSKAWDLKTPRKWWFFQKLRMFPKIFSHSANTSRRRRNRVEIRAWLVYLEV